MLWVGIGEVFAFLLTEVFLKNPTMELNRYERPVWILLFAFVFLVFEWFFLLSAWRFCFKGFSMLAQFHGGERLLREKRGKTLCERMTVYSTVFVIAKPLLTLIPELFVLTSFEKDAENPLFTFDWYAYADTFRILCAAFSAVLGLVWLIGVLRLLLQAYKDEPWSEALRYFYESEILPKKSFLLYRRIGTAFGFFRVGAVFLINLTLLYYEFLPDWFSALLFLCGAMVLGSLLGDLRIQAVVSVLLLGAGISRMMLDFQYLEKHVPKDALYQPTAYAKYLPVRILGTAEALLALWLVLLFIYAICRMAKNYTAVVYEGDAALSERATERMHAQIQKKAYLAGALFLLSTVVKNFEIWVLQEQFAWIWVLQVAVSVGAVIAFSVFLSEISEQISEKYSSET